MAGPNKDPRGLLTASHLPLADGERLERASCRGPNRNDPSGAVRDPFARLRWQSAKLPVHFVIERVLGGDGSKSVEPDIQGDPGRLHSLGPKGFKDFRGEVQPRGWGGSATPFAVVHRLVSFPVSQAGVNVGRQGRESNSIQACLGIVAEDLDNLSSLDQVLLDSRLETFLQVDERPGLEPLARPRKSLESEIAEVAEKKEFYLTTSWLCPKHSQRGYPGVVQDEQIPCFEQSEDLPELAMVNFTGISVDVEEQGSVPLRQRNLGDPIFGQLVFESC